jgi:hypothetical protein
MAAAAVTLVIGRYSPDWLAAMAGRQVIPGRYLVIAALFWGALFLLAMNAGRIAALAVSVVVFSMTFGTWSWQWRVSREWAGHFERFDAIASGFLVGVSDPEMMALVFPDPAVRDRVVDYMRRRRLGVFHEARATWLGHTTNKNCYTIGRQSANRISGYLPTRERYLAVTDAIGTIVGLARTIPAEEGVPYLGYARAPVGQASACGGL